MIPDEEDFISKKLIFNFLTGESDGEKRYRVAAVTKRASFRVARSEPMEKQEAQLFLQDLEAKINTSSVRAVSIGDTLVMVEEIGHIDIEEEEGVK